MQNTRGEWILLYGFLRRIVWFILKIWNRLEIKGVENIPPEGRLMIVANHVSVMDPIVLGVSCPRQIRFMAKSELFEIPFLGKLIQALGAFSVDREKTDFQSVKNSLKVLNNEEVLGIFPQGGTRKNETEIKFRSGAAAIALKSRSTILPVAIVGTKDPYKMLLFGKLQVNIGKPIDWTTTYIGKSKNEDIAALNEEMEKTVEKLLKLNRFDENS